MHMFANVCRKTHDEDLDMISKTGSSVKAPTFFLSFRKQLELFCTFKISINDGE